MQLELSLFRAIGVKSFRQAILTIVFGGGLFLSQTLVGGTSSLVRALNSAAGRRPRGSPMAEDSGAILRHISSLKDMLDKVNEEIEQNIQRTREMESEIAKHSYTEKDYLVKESELMKGVSVAEFELDGLMQVAGAGTDSLKVMEGNLEFQKATLNEIRKRFSDKMERFIADSKGFQANIFGGSNDDLHVLLKEKDSLEDESENLWLKINTIQSSSTAYIVEILEEVNMENSVLESELQYKISEYVDVLKDINNLKILFSSINS
ncbi:uncharacterized protein LOC100834001 [Brachypodium distachyon]|nr:uncharacterized protein LOC100834001 [Brachypodium distachyon]|eukprot:XP_003568702.2 uncharacterized protein LOC100834001 [Brachypodium distachyon]